MVSNMMKMCEICRVRAASYTCVSCGKKVCADCYLAQVGVCDDCAKGKERSDLLLKQLKECGAIQFGVFKLASGKESQYYVDIKKASTNPEILKEIAENMERYVDAERIAGMALGAVPIAVALSLKTRIPFVIIRKEEKMYGTAKQIEGEIKQGEKVIVVEDVATTGGSVKKAVDVLRSAGANCERALVVVDRKEGAEELLAEHGVKLISLIKMTDLM